MASGCCISCSSIRKYHVTQLFQKGSGSQRIHSWFLPALRHYLPLVSFQNCPADGTSLPKASPWILENINHCRLGFNRLKDIFPLHISSLLNLPPPSPTVLSAEEGKFAAVQAPSTGRYGCPSRCTRKCASPYLTPSSGRTSQEEKVQEVQKLARKQTRYSPTIN